LFSRRKRPRKPPAERRREETKSREEKEARGEEAARRSPAGERVRGGPLREGKEIKKTKGEKSGGGQVIRSRTRSVNSAGVEETLARLKTSTPSKGKGREAWTSS